MEDDDQECQQQALDVEEEIFNVYKFNLRNGHKPYQVIEYQVHH
jgi:hypothetical protein